MKRILQKKIELQIVCPILLLMTGFLWCGGYYEYSSAIIGAFAVIMVWVANEKKKKGISFENYLLFAACLSLFYFLSCIYATDRGMALIGAAKKSTILLFALAISMLSTEQRKWLITKLPEMSMVTVVVGAIGAVVPVTRSYVIAAGRFCGTFGYANAYALFLVLALLVLLETYSERKGFFKNVIGGVLLVALWFTGSRYTWILTGVLLIIYIIGQQKVRKIGLSVLAVFGVATVAAATILRQSEAMGRLFSTNLSTFYGRLLYWQDAWQLVKKHPFGMGYLGYYYEQTKVQTGVYTVRYVHNDLLQWVLDIGWIPALLLVFLVGFALFNKKRSRGQKMLLLTLLLHSFMEFDFEHTAVAFLWILVLSCTEEKLFVAPKSEMISQQNNKRKKCNTRNSSGWDGYLPVWAGKVIAGILGCVCFYLAVPLSMYAMGKIETAALWYPVYTDAQLALLSVEEDTEEAEKLADTILKQNDTAFLAYDAKAQVAYQNCDFAYMMQYKRSAIARNKYDANEYVDYLTLLNGMLVYSQEQEDGELQEKAISEMEQLLELIQSNEATVSRLGKKIDDRVEIALPEDIVEQIQKLREN